MERDQEFLEYLVKSIVDHPDDVKVERKIDEMGVLLTLKVNAMDMGQVVGKSNARVNLKIVEPDGSTRRPREESGDSIDKAVEGLNL